jgi:hypothetical protein
LDEVIVRLTAIPETARHVLDERNVHRDKLVPRRLPGRVAFFGRIHDLEEFALAGT